MSPYAHTSAPWALTLSGLGVTDGRPDPVAGFPNGRTIAMTAVMHLPLAERQAAAYP